MPRFVFEPVDVETLDPDDVPVVVIGTEEFRCIGVMPSGAYRSLGQYTFSTEAAHRFIEGCMVDEESVARWRVTCSDKQRLVPQSVVEDVFDTLMEWYGNRPSVPSSASADGRLITEHGSTDEPSETTSPLTRLRSETALM